MWLVFALLAPLFFAIVHILDSYCVEEIFEKPWMGVVTSSLASFVVFAPLPYILPFVSWQWPTWEIIAMAFLAGVFIQLSQVLYFHALAKSEAGIVAAYWNMTPALLLIMSYLIFHDVLCLRIYIGIAILIIASTYMFTLDNKIDTRIGTLLLMLVACVIYAIAFILQDQVFLTIPYTQGFYLTMTGIIAGGVIPILVKKIRLTLLQSLKGLIANYRIFILIEIVNVTALAATMKAVELGNPSIVAAVIDPTLPAFTFLLSALFLIFNATKKLGDSRSIKQILNKLLTVGIMGIGVWLLS